MGPPSSAMLAEIARRHKVDFGEVRTAPLQGVANRVYFLGADLVLRIARPESADDLRKEAIVIPAAVHAGVRTPELVAFDDALLDTPYMVVRRAAGIAPGLPADPADERWRPVYRRLGRELAVLHGGIDALPGVRVDSAADPRIDVAALADAGSFGVEVADWLIDWFDRLETGLSAAPDLRLIHGDAAPTNLLVDPDSQRLNVILDWGDAAWADPASEFAKLPLRAVPAALEGYMGEVDISWAARVLWHHLHWALGRIATGVEPRAAHWSARPGDRLLEMMRFFLADPPHPWPELR